MVAAQCTDRRAIPATLRTSVGTAVMASIAASPPSTPSCCNEPRSGSVVTYLAICAAAVPDKGGWAWQR
jgi:hypothetical protein